MTALITLAPCPELQASPGELAIVFPGGARLTASSGVDTGDPGAIVQSLLATTNTALVPLQPFFTLIDTFVQTLKTIQAVPESVLTLDPTKVVNEIGKLVLLVDKLATMVPQLSVPVMALGIIDAIIAALQAVKGKMVAMIAAQARITNAQQRAATLGNTALATIAACSQSNLLIQQANTSASFQPVNRLIMLLNALLQLAGLPCIPTIGGLAGVTEEALEPLDTTITLLTTVRSLIPVGAPALPALPSAGTC